MISVKRSNIDVFFDQKSMVVTNDQDRRSLGMLFLYKSERSHILLFTARFNSVLDEIGFMTIESSRCMTSPNPDNHFMILTYTLWFVEHNWSSIRFDQTLILSMMI